MPPPISPASRFSKSRQDGLILLVLGCLIFLLLGGALGATSHNSMLDFKSLYYGARCLAAGHDPFQHSVLLKFFLEDGGARPWDTAKTIRIATQSGNLPTAFSFIALFAVLPWGAAHALLMIVIGAAMSLASFLMWRLGAGRAPLLSGSLIFILIASSQILLLTGNAAGVVVGLTVIATWCFLEERFALAGILCLAVSLTIKPHDCGLVWLYFFLAGGVYRKRALQTLLAAVVIGLPALLVVWHVAPHWRPELQADLNAFFAPGDVADPHLAAMGVHGIGMLVNLQTALCFFWNNPRFYNWAAYLIAGALIVFWGVVVLRSRRSMFHACLALAAIAPLSMLPVYHRTYDAKLLLLTVPACAMLWAEGRFTGRLALFINIVGLVFSADLLSMALIAIDSKFHVPPLAPLGHLMTGLQVFAAPLSLLAMGIFYLWVFAERARAQDAFAGPTAPAPLSQTAVTPSSR